MTLDQLRKAIERDVRKLEHEIATHQLIASPDIKRIAQALVRYFDANKPRTM